MPTDERAILESATESNFFTIWHIEKVGLKAYHPTGYGEGDCFNQTSKRWLQIILTEKKIAKWDVDGVRSCSAKTPVCKMGFPPYFLMFCVEASEILLGLHELDRTPAT